MEKLIQDGCGWISHCSSQISVHPCKPSACADPAETGESKGRAQLPAVLQELHLPMSPMWCSPAERRGPGMHGEPPGNAQLRGCPPTCKTQTQKPGQTSQWTFLPTDIPPTDILEGRVCSRSSAPIATLAAGGGLRPGIAPVPAPQLRVLPFSSCSRTLSRRGRVRALSAGHPRVSFGIFLSRAPGTRVIHLVGSQG